MREALSAITLEDIDRRPAIKINYLEARPACTRRVQTRSWRSDPFQVTLEVAFLMVNAARSARLPTSARLLA
jgi:hypothetical protein